MSTETEQLNAMIGRLQSRAEVAEKRAEEAERKLPGYVNDWNAYKARALAAEAEVEAFRFYSDEFCQGDETAEQAAHAMFDAVVAHRRRAEVAEARISTLEEAAKLLVAVLAERTPDPRWLRAVAVSALNLRKVLETKP